MIPAEEENTLRNLEEDDEVSLKYKKLVSKFVTHSLYNLVKMRIYYSAHLCFRLLIDSRRRKEIELPTPTAELVEGFLCFTKI